MTTTVFIHLQIKQQQMKKIFYTFVLLFIALLGADAQTVVTGVYADSTTTEPIPYATVAIFKGDKGQPESVTLTTLDGSFELRTKGKGDYRFSITNMGNKPIEKTFVASGQTLDFGTLLASSMSEKLEELTVVAQKPIIKSEVDRITYDVEADPEAPAKNALDMLRKMPLITVDGEDNIQLNGSSSFKIHVNGNPSSLFDNEPGKTLKGIPATAIKNVEVITSPGAKYDAEGVGGIINIVMSQGTNMDGYTATVSVNGELPKSLNGSVNLMVKKGKLTVSGRAFYNKRRNNDFDIDYKFEYLLKDGTDVTKMSNVQAEGNRFGMANLDMSYEIDTMRLINITWNYREGSGYNEIFNATVDNLKNNKRVFSLKTDSYNKWIWSGNEFNFNYERKINKDHSLTLSLKAYTSPKGGGESYMKYYDWQIEGSVPENYVDTESDNDEESGEYVGQLDYIGKLNENNSLEAGVKYTLRKNDSESQTLYTRDILPIIADSSMSSSLSHQQGILAGYASYTLKLNKFSTKLGVRVENSVLDAESLYGETKTTFDYNETDFVPSVYFAYNFTHTNSLKLSYNMRIMRPGIHYLNPYREEQTPFQIRYGNIELDSEHHHSMSLSYSSFAQKVMFNTSLTYNYCDNAIVNYRFMNDEVMESTFGNYGLQHSVRLSVFSNITFSKSTSMWLNGGLSYIDIVNNTTDDKANGFQPNIFAGLNQKLPLGMQAGLFGGFNGKGVQLQSEGFNMYIYGVNVNKSMLNDRLTFSLAANSFFNPILKITQIEESVGARSEVNGDFPIWRVRAGVSFRIGDLKTSVKKTRSIESDDVLGGGNESGGEDSGMQGVM